MSSKAAWVWVLKKLTKAQAERLRKRNPDKINPITSVGDGDLYWVVVSKKKGSRIFA